MASREVRNQPHWPERLAELFLVLPNTAHGFLERQKALEEAWLILRCALEHYLRLHAPRLGRVSAEDIEDIASEKTLDLLRKIESGVENRALTRHPGLAGYISTVARNGLVDLLRSRGREVELDPSSGSPNGKEPEAVEARQPAAEDSGLPLARKSFAQALRECAETIPSRNAQIWFLRVFYEMSSKEIAASPGIGLQTGHIDVILQRVRNAIRDCMKRKGFDSTDMPSGVFADLWETFGPILLAPREESP